MSSIVTMLIGATGLVGRMTKFIGPITVSTLIILLMLSSVPLVVQRMEKHWISLMFVLFKIINFFRTIAALLCTILYLHNIKVPLIGIRNHRLHIYRINLFGQFPVFFIK